MRVFACFFIVSSRTVHQKSNQNVNMVKLWNAGASENLGRRSPQTKLDSEVCREGPSEFTCVAEATEIRQSLV